MPVYYRRWLIRRIIRDNEKLEAARKGEQENVSNNMDKLSRFEKMISKKNK